MGVEVVQVRDYGEGLVEVTWNFSKRKGDPERTPRGESEASSEIRERSMVRARRRITRKVLHGGLDHLLTLNYRENVQDLDRAKRELQRFCELVQVGDPEWRYLAIWERQKRGAYHFHLALRGRQDVRKLREIWWGIVGKGEGNIDVQEIRSRKEKNKRLSVARYLSKYLGKDESDWELNKKTYFHSKNVEDPPVENVAIVTNGELDVWDCIEDVIRARGGEGIQQKWSELCERWGWAASFKGG